MALHEPFRPGRTHAPGNVAGQYLADALTVWDCYADQELEGAPLLLRFEDFDMVFSAGQEGDLAFWQGSVGTSHAAKAADGGRTEAIDSRFCPAWVPAPALSGVIGEQAKGAVRVDGANGLVRFGNAHLHLAGNRSSISYYLVEIP